MSTAAYRNPQENLHASAHHTDAGKRTHYERHRPVETILYQLVQEHVETFFAQVEAETGSGLPDFVKDEFDAFLECGILAHGFLRLRCVDCTHEKLVAFSCKRRGFCPSCGGRRMAQTAAHLVDHVIPNVPVRQWVLSLPIPLRYLLAAHPHLLCSAFIFPIRELEVLFDAEISVESGIANVGHLRVEHATTAALTLERGTLRVRSGEISDTPTRPRRDAGARAMNSKTCACATSPSRSRVQIESWIREGRKRAS